jgi:hypothetical protein
LPQGEDAAKVLLLGDRGAKDDLSLLPPLPGWAVLLRLPSMEARPTLVTPMLVTPTSTFVMTEKP